VIFRDVKARHRLARQQSIEKVGHAGHGLSHSAGVNHLADGANTPGKRHDKESLQDVRNADDRCHSGKEFHIARAHRAEDVQDKHHGEAQPKSLKARDDSVHACKKTIEGNTGDYERQHQPVGNAPIAHVHVNDCDR